VVDPKHNKEIDVTLMVLRVIDQMATGEISPEEAEEHLRVINQQFPQDCPKCGEPLHGGGNEERQ
jgi:hypothetical protein